MEQVCAYIRVSTSQQAQHDLSLPDQERAIAEYAESKGWEIARVFVEAGVSARSDNRPVFQEMMAEALSKPAPYKHVVVHSMSRIFRDEMYYEWYRRKLDANGVSIVSITQDFGTGQGADLTRRIMALTDEMNSLENGKHVQRTMIANAQQNFWNGSIPPIGYKAVVAEIRGNKEKKKLEIDPETSDLVRRIFKLYLDGDGENGPLGILSIVKHLNSMGYRSPTGKPIYASLVEKILKNETYAGTAWYGVRDSKTGIKRPKEEWIPIKVPPIVSPEDFQRVQTQLELRSPKVTAPRLVNSPVLLTGLVTCAGCGAKMRRATGKGGQYAYYRCFNHRDKSGNAACEGSDINAEVLDRVILENISTRVLEPDRVQKLVCEIAEFRAAGNDEKVKNLEQLRKQMSEYKKKISRMMTALADGVIVSSETFKETISGFEGDLQRTEGIIRDHERVIGTRIKEITLEQASEVAIALRTKLAESAPALRKRIVRSFVSRVLVSREAIAIHGAEGDLAEVVTGSLKA